MKIIGLCGGSGSGKGSVCDVFRRFGIPSIDTDAVYHELTSANGECLDALAKEFGSEIISERGSLDRKKLGAIVFCGENSEEKLDKLNKLSHKFILDETRRRLDTYSQLDAPMAIVDAPLLFESGFDGECDLLICVIADMETRIARIMARDNISRESAEQRIAAQMSDEDIISKCNFVIYNNSDLDSLTNQIIRIIDEINNNF